MSLSSASAKSSTAGVPSASTLKDEEFRNQLIIQGLPTVRFVLNQVLPRVPRFIEAEELFSAGVMGLVDAATRYDARKEVRFRTYAELRVRGAMLDYLRSLSGAPRGLHKRQRELDAARSAVEQRTGCVASISEIADEIKMSSEECDRLLAMIRSLHTTEWESLSECERERADQSRCADDLSADVERRQLIELVWRAVERLPERQRLVLWLYYCEGLKLKELGTVLGITEGRASQLRSKAILTVRCELAAIVGAESGGPTQQSTTEGGDKRLSQQAGVDY